MPLLADDKLTIGIDGAVRHYLVGKQWYRTGEPFRHRIQILLLGRLLFHIQGCVQQTYLHHEVVVQPVAAAYAVARHLIVIGHRQKPVLVVFPHFPVHQIGRAHV